ncbi:cell division protein FtsQ/DivIB [Rhodoferax saidenbachensis]|uniref:Cell division protein FtsQ n=1 Tax=Rhodoferax saidenbachensis TaxID=1484693 RepID=A0A1P8KDR9_9BURK|nr:cell division protein FtsQ/DivIB [Rhodoferax saidenbachensis]APW44096.1 cell division protein FtsQ [Rhodoferax saidenbachensis]
MTPAVANPLDVKLMNMAATVLFVVFVVLGGLAAARWLSRLPVFAIQGIAVTGDVNHNNTLTLRANVAPRMAGTFFTVDLARVRAAFEAVPWVRHAVVHRDFPNRLRVTLQEHQAVAYWGAEGELRLINSFGEVFEANVDEVDQDTLPRLNGPEDQGAEVLAMYRAVAPLFTGMELPVEQLELSGRGGWRVRLDSGAVIELGRGSVDDVVPRLQRFLKTLTQVTSRYGRHASAIESADLRHDNGYAIRLRGVSTLVPESPKR